jgi:hypothetical protein
MPYQVPMTTGALSFSSKFIVRNKIILGMTVRACGLCIALIVLVSTLKMNDE